MLSNRCFMPDPRSDCVDLARGQLCLEPYLEQDTPSKAMMFATCTGSDATSRYALKDSVSGKAVGEASYWSMGRKEDTVGAYVVASLRSSVFLEAVAFQSAPREFQLYRQGIAFGSLVEQDLPKPEGFWRRFLGGKRLWHVFLQDDMIGQIEFSYPLSKKSRLFLELNDTVSLPIGLASVWFKKDSSFVIPPDTPEVSDPDLETLHFLLAIVFRIAILNLDRCSG